MAASDIDLGDLPADPVDLLALARPIAEAVAAHLEGALDGAGPSVTSKSNATDLVTELDTWAEGFIVERLLEARPDDGLVGEEGADRASTSGVTWCIDPIDGTVNFVHRLPGFCVSIAAQVAGRSVAAVVAVPVLHETFSATLGGGATVAKDGGHHQPIRCATPASLDRAVIATGFGYDPDRRRRQAEVLAQVIPHVADIRRVGAAAFDLCLVACGRVDGYWESGLNPWDRAGGSLIATEAGARCEGHDGGPATRELTIAAPVEVFDDLRALLDRTGAVLP